MSKKELNNTNVVILAKSHNPTIISKEWVIKKDVLEGPIINFIHTPPFSMVENNDLRIHVDSGRMQIIVKRVEPDIIDKLPIVIKNYVNSLPETPYTAIGFNFSYREITEKNLGRIFSPDVEKFRKAFSEDYRVGGIIQFNFDEFIVTVNLRPEEKVIADFNFHSNIKDGSGEIIEKIKSYHETMRKAEGVLEVLFDD
nr:hypothetical protein BSM_16930 [uncultured archaeon]